MKLLRLVTLGSLVLSMSCGGFAPGLPSTARPEPETPAVVAGASGEGPAQRLSLEEVLTHSAEHSPRLELAESLTTRGEAEVIAASPALPANPTVSVSVGGRLTDGGHHVEMLYSLEQPLEIAGEAGLRRRVASKVRDIFGADLDVERWRLAQDVRCAFYGALLARERLEAAEALVAFTEGVAGVTKRRVDAGDVSPVTLLVARSEVALARQERVAAEQAYDVGRLQLAELIGWPPGRQVEPAGEACPVRRAPSTKALVAQTLDGHPALRRHRHALDAAAARVRLEDREAWPEPTLGVTYAREGAERDNPQLWLITLGLPVPLFQRNQGSRARARSDLAVAQAELDTWILALPARLQQAARAVDAAAERVEIFGADIVPAMERNLEQIRRAYELGELDIHQVSQTRQRVLESERAALEARADYLEAAARLQTLVGSEVWGQGGPTQRQEEP